jgi:hypothetical protein
MLSMLYILAVSSYLRVLALYTSLILSALASSLCYILVYLYVNVLAYNIMHNTHIHIAHRYDSSEIYLSSFLATET